jgi:hypothetical protein
VKETIMKLSKAVSFDGNIVTDKQSLQVLLVEADGRGLGSSSDYPRISHWVL